MTENSSRNYATELEERLTTLDELPNDEFVTRGLVFQVALATLVLPVLALLIGWITL